MNNDNDEASAQWFVNRQIDNYAYYFTQQLKELSELQNKLYKKIILATFLDTFAIARFPGFKVGERFKRLIRECTFWGNDSEKICLPQLYYRLIYKGATTPLKDYLDRRLRTW